MELWKKEKNKLTGGFLSPAPLLFHPASLSTSFLTSCLYSQCLNILLTLADTLTRSLLFVRYPHRCVRHCLCHVVAVRQVYASDSPSWTEHGRATHIRCPNVSCLVFLLTKAAALQTRTMDDLRVFTLTWLWKSWQWAKHSIKLPSSPTQTADSRSWNCCYDLDSLSGGQRLQLRSAPSLAPSFPLLLFNPRQGDSESQTRTRSKH